MSANTKIEWTEATWNPIRGCSRVSEGCRKCYAERQAARFAGDKRTTKAGTRTGPQPYSGLVVMKSDGPHWTGEVRFAENHLGDPLRWRQPKRIFVNSMSDLFHEKVKGEWLNRMFSDVMEIATHHTFQILTKRPKRMLEYLSWRWGEGRIPMRNIWLGVSVEDQKTADERIPLLLQTPAAVRWVSYEPALGPVNLRREWIDPQGESEFDVEPTVQWLVAGGESGPGARPSHPDNFREVRDQCQAAGVPFFFKQWGEWLPFDQQEGRNIHMDDIDRANGSDRVGKKRAGRLLDGREWNEYPESR